MDKHWSAVCALILTLCAFVHFNTVFAAGTARAKPGICPRLKSGGVGICAEYCSKDCDCPNEEKCCSNGCGHVCMTPHTVKPGRCALPQGTPVCAEYCYHDGDCPGEQKCCKTSCGHACSEPC